ncbi:MAG: SurA N-terminal domain-containing protein [Desulfobacterales bacterium]
MKWVTLAGCFFIIGPVLISQTFGAEVVDRIVAVVNNEIISLYELNQLTKPFIERIKQANLAIERERKEIFEVRRQILNKLIDDKLADQELKRHNITVSAKEIDSALESIKQRALVTDEELRAELASQGLTMEEYRSRTKEQLLRSKLINLEVRSKIVVNQEDVKDYYEKNKQVYAGEKKYHLRNIIMPLSPLTSDEEKRRRLIKMENVLEQLRQGQDFVAMARKYSQSSIAAEGGDLGFFRLDELSRELRSAIAKLRAGEFTGVIETEMGFQILFVEEVREKPGKSLKEATPEITHKLYSEIVNEKYRSWLENLRARSHIKIIM